MTSADGGLAWQNDGPNQGTSGGTLKDEKDFIRQQGQRESCTWDKQRESRTRDVIGEAGESRLGSTAHRAGHSASAKSRGPLNAKLRQGSRVQQVGR